MKMYINNDIDYIKYLKNKNIIIFGAGSFGAKISKQLLGKEISVNYFCYNDEMKRNQIVNEIKVINFNDLLDINYEELYNNNCK